MAIVLYAPALALSQSRLWIDFEYEKKRKVSFSYGFEYLVICGIDRSDLHVLFISCMLKRKDFSFSICFFFVWKGRNESCDMDRCYSSCSDVCWFTSCAYSRL